MQDIVIAKLEKQAIADMVGYKKKDDTSHWFSIDKLPSVQRLTQFGAWSPEVSRHILDGWTFGINYSKRKSFKYLYILKDKDNPVVKIGVTKNVESRKKQLENSSGRRFAIAFVSERIESKSCHERETALKAYFESPKLPGEYFSCEIISLEQYIAKAKTFTSHSSV